MVLALLGGCSPLEVVPPREPDAELLARVPPVTGRARASCDAGPTMLATVRGRVHTTAGEPVAHAAMGARVEGREGHVLLGHTDQDGRYTISFDAPASYTVLAIPSEPGERCLLASGEESDELLVEDADFVVGETHQAEVLVLNEHGAPVPAAGVGVRSVWRHQPHQPVAHTDEQGRAGFALGLVRSSISATAAGRVLAGDSSVEPSSLADECSWCLRGS